MTENVGNSPDLTFEEAFTRLESTVARLENSGLTVDELVEEFEQGMTLVKHCQRLLESAQLRVAVLIREDEADPQGKDLLAET